MSYHRYKALFAISILIICISCGCDQSPSNEDLQTAEYIRTFGKMLNEYKTQMPLMQAEAAKEGRNLYGSDKNGLDAAQLKISHSLERLLDRVNPLISKMEEIVPPDKLREYHAVNLECTKAQAEIIQKMINALRARDITNYEGQMRHFNSYVSKCNNRIQDALKKAGYNSAEDVKRAIEAVAKTMPNSVRRIEME